jgi:hypothetical protein
MTQSPSAVPSNVITLATLGSSARRSSSLAIWTSSSAKTTTLSESLMMNATSSAIVDG